MGRKHQTAGIQLTGFSEPLYNTFQGKIYV